jgi:universal stress protein E
VRMGRALAPHPDQRLSKKGLYSGTTDIDTAAHVRWSSHGHVGDVETSGVHADRGESLESGMRKLNRILAVLDGTDADAMILGKAVASARRQGASLELFLCDAEQAYSLRHAYDPRGVEESRQNCTRQAKHYLECLRDTVVGADVRISVDAACESPLYEGIVRKVMKSGADLVIKNAARARPLRPSAWEANDWQLMRACPATLLLSRGRSWHPYPRLAAAVDLSEHESSDLLQAIIQTSKRFIDDCHGELDIVYSEAGDIDPGKREASLAALEEVTRAAGLQGSRVHVLSGAAEETLPTFAADRDYDAFIMGALTHRKGLSALVGTLTARLIETLDCDFVLVKPGSYRSQVELATADPPSEPEVAPVLEPRQAPAPGFVTPWQLPTH